MAAPRAPNTKGREGTRTIVLVLGCEEHADVLAGLLTLGDEVRRALVALATSSGAQTGVLEAVAELWPNLLPEASADSARRKAGGA